jgi:DNA-binding LacI/PurR family transcriptional regulator
MKARIKLEHIAKEAGVSKMAVSLALRNDPSISVNKAQQIRDIAKRLGYVPNRIAQGLSSGRTYTIAAIVGGAMHDDYHNQFLRGATDYAINHGYTLTIGLNNRDQALELEMIDKFQQMMVDGYLAFHSGSMDVYTRLKQQKIPFVLYTKYFKDLDSDYVVCNDAKGGNLLTKYFISQGHSRIAFLYDDSLAESSEVLGRIAGYRSALEQSRIGYDPTLVLPCYFCYSIHEFKTRNQAVISLLSDNLPTAIFVCNDSCATAFYRTIKSLGFKIPEDISIGGYEGVYLGEILDPPLTTVSSPLIEMGKTACKLLIDKIEGTIPIDQISRIQMEPVLTIRDSCIRR